MAIEDRDWYREEAGEAFWRELNDSIGAGRPPIRPPSTDLSRRAAAAAQQARHPIHGPQLRRSLKSYFTRPLGGRDILLACVGAGGMAIYLVLHSV